MIEKEPFRKYNLEKSSDTFNVRFNEEERLMFEADKKLLNQVKDSTAMKQCWQIARIVLHEQKMSDILDVVFKNKQRNKRLGIVDFD